MNQSLRTVMLTGNDRRHRWLAHQLARQLNLVGIVGEAKPTAITSTTGLPPDDALIVDRHFSERDGAEAALLGNVAAFPCADVRVIPTGALNSEDVFRWVREREPDYLVLYGSGILKAPLLELYDGRVINLHLGLSPYYRGSGTNFWPFVDGVPECVGATIHLAVSRVDAGGILGQVRPHPEAADRIHELGTRTIMAAAECLPGMIARYDAGKVVPRTQDLTAGRVYRNRDFSADAVRAAWRQLDDGMMGDYVADMSRRRERFPIVES
jgi:folate-dependent phosphoribosylglycinamide formyltransferase PurN